MNLRRVVVIVAWAVTALLVSLHVNQSIVRSKGEFIPGDLGDGRFNNYVMEHDYLSLLGYYDWFSPGQFFPEEKTLFYSDNHWGTAGIYILFRTLGLSVEGSFQAWFLIVGALNALALLYLFHTLRVGLFIACPLTFFGVSSFALVFKLGHAQVLLLFPFILSLCFFLQFLREGNVRKLAFSVLFYAYQHYCYMYYGYLMTYIYAFLFISFCLLCANQDYWRRVRESLSHRQDRAFFFGVLTVAGVSIFLLYLPYALNSTGSPSMEELRFLSPNLGAWFSASPQSLFYKSHSFYKSGASAIESTLFYGYAAWVLLFAVFVYFLRVLIREGIVQVPYNVRMGLSMLLSCLFLAAFVTTWFGSWGNLYLLIPSVFEPARAFRSFGRVVYLIIVVEAVAAGLILTYLFNLKPRFAKICAVGAACLFAIESIATSQPHAYSKLEARERRNKVVDSWESQGSEDVLLLAPRSPDAPFYVIQLDAWSAALYKGKKTINGYSGNFPEAHTEFVLSPTPENAELLLDRLGLEHSGITVIN